MNRLGFQYEPRQKTYYVDTHETPANVTYRKDFIDRYFQYEILAHCGYSITSIEREKLVENGEIHEELGYKYEKNGEVFYEYHVDNCQTFQDACDNVPFRGHLSVRKPIDKK